MSTQKDANFHPMMFFITKDAKKDTKWDFGSSGY